MGDFASFFRGKRVLVTGHTGFKGAWLSLWLRELGADVSGLALPPNGDPNLADALRPEPWGRSYLSDLRDGRAVADCVRQVEPELVFHLAAQPLVRASYASPMQTFETNALGTASLLEALRTAPAVRAIVVVTSDKCYRNVGDDRAFVEGDPLGGDDPYSASKACAELIAASYRASYFLDARVGLATARAGNVLGGGDWAPDRIVPDLVRAWRSGAELELRNPNATRPWQHVLESLAGYLLLASRLHADPGAFSEAWNFGPTQESSRSVGWVVEEFAKRGVAAKQRAPRRPQPPESMRLRLDSSKSADRLAWRSRWSAEVAIERTALWYAGYYQGGDAGALCRADMEAFNATTT